MAGVIRDELDFAAYMRDTEARVKVRPASLFAEELVEKFRPVAKPTFQAEMFSTKLRDRLIFRPGEVTVWAGYNGHRKSTFSGQCALDLCVSREKVLIASFEMTPAETLARMAKQCFAVDRPAADSLRAFSQWTDGRLWLFDHRGRITPEKMMAVIRYFAEELQGTQVFIDSMMMVCGSEESLDEQKQFCTDVVRAAQEYSLHIHVIAHCRKPAHGGEDKPPTKYDLRGSAAISDQAHNVVMVWANKPKYAALERNPNDYEVAQQPDAKISVEKQRNGRWEGAVKLWFHEPSMRFCDTYEAPVEPYVLRPL